MSFYKSKIGKFIFHYKFSTYNKSNVLESVKHITFTPNSIDRRFSLISSVVEISKRLVATLVLKSFIRSVQGPVRLSERVWIFVRNSLYSFETLRAMLPSWIRASPYCFFGIFLFYKKWWFCAFNFIRILANWIFHTQPCAIGDIVHLNNPHF